MRTSVAAVRGLRSCGLQALEHRLSSCGAQASFFHGMWDPPRPEIKPVSLALAGGFFTTEPPGKPLVLFLLSYSSHGREFAWFEEVIPPSVPKDLGQEADVKIQVSRGKCQYFLPVWGVNIFLTGSYSKFQTPFLSYIFRNKGKTFHLLSSEKLSESLISNWDMLVNKVQKVWAANGTGSGMFFLAGPLFPQPLHGRRSQMLLVTWWCARIQRAVQTASKLTKDREGWTFWILGYFFSEILVD